MEKEIRDIISKLKNHQISLYDIPYEYRENLDIVKAERKLNLIQLDIRGYDVIMNKFFAREQIVQNTTINSFYYDYLEGFGMLYHYFDDFNAYYDFVEGDIYENACYYKLNTAGLPDSVDKNRITKTKSFIESKNAKTISAFSINPNEDEINDYLLKEKRKKEIKRWLDKFYSCTSYDQLRKTVLRYSLSPLCREIDILFFFWNYILTDINNPDRFNAVMKYISTGDYPSYHIAEALCMIYDPDKVVANYAYSTGAKSTKQIHKSSIKNTAQKVKHSKYNLSTFGRFDDVTHYFCVETKVYDQISNYLLFSICEYFETIDDFLTRLNNNLTNCNLSKMQNCSFDFSTCFTDSSTILPTSNASDYRYKLEKTYKDGKFVVNQSWVDKNNHIIKRYKHSFRLFCDFVAFLEYDLSGAALFDCEGLSNIANFSDLLLTNAELPSVIRKKLHFKYDLLPDSCFDLVSFGVSEKNEKETSMISRPEQQDDDVSIKKINKLFYVSDLHLDFKIMNEGCRSFMDCKETIHRIALQFRKEMIPNSGVILIVGDTASDYEYFKLFVMELAKIIDNDYPKIVFTLGNHELWQFPGMKTDDIVNKYRVLIESHKMYLLHNSILYQDINDNWGIIDSNTISNTSPQYLRNKLKTAQLVIFGSLGFSGRNKYFNANNGIYQNVIDHELEIQESKKCDLFYSKVCNALKGLKLIVATHMPLSDWHEPSFDTSININDSNVYSREINGLYQPGFIYINGHTHNNHYYDDGNTCVYADNQFGYNKNTPSAWPTLKYFYLDKSSDLFVDYNDGIYEITPDEYNCFYRAKRLFMSYNRDVPLIYMLKRGGFYCFIQKTSAGNLCILNGGQIKRLPNNEIEFYFNNMDTVISTINKPLSEYTKYQHKIAKAIKQIGGTGFIHGCIVDIDYFNHIYVNPFNSSIMAYWASDIVNKMIYPSVVDLLEDKCSSLYESYKNLLSCEKDSSIPSVFEHRSAERKKPILYLETDMYRASREICKMQKINSKILTIWLDSNAQFEITTHEESPVKKLDRFT